MAVSEIQKLLNVYTDKDLEKFLEDSRSFTKFEANLDFILDTDNLYVDVIDNDDSELELEKDKSDWYGSSRSGLKDLFRFIITKNTADDGKTVPNGVLKFCVDIQNYQESKTEFFKLVMNSSKFKSPLVFEGNSKQFLGTDFATLKVSLIQHYNKENPSKDWLTPKQLDVKLTIDRITKEDYRREYFYLNTLQAPSIKAYIHRVFDPGLKDSNNGGYSHRSSRHYHSHFLGDLKQIIYKQYKDNIVFLLEYLYGKRINITSKMDEVIGALERVPRNDLGLLEVDKVRTLLAIIKDNTKIIDLNNKLKALGVAPATDLKRWTKKLKKQSNDNAIQLV